MHRLHHHPIRVVHTVHGAMGEDVKNCKKTELVKIYEKEPKMITETKALVEKLDHLNVLIADLRELSEDKTLNAETQNLILDALVGLRKARAKLMQDLLKA